MDFKRFKITVFSIFIFAIFFTITNIVKAEDTAQDWWAFITSPFNGVIKSSPFLWYESKYKRFQLLGNNLIGVEIAWTPLKRMIIKETGDIVNDNFPYSLDELYFWYWKGIWTKINSNTTNFIPTPFKNSDTTAIYTNILADTEWKPIEDYTKIKINSSIQSESQPNTLWINFSTNLNFNGTISYTEIENYNIFTGVKTLYRLWWNKKIHKIYPVSIDNEYIVIFEINSWTFEQYLMKIQGNKIEIKSKINIDTKINTLDLTFLWQKREIWDKYYWLYKTPDNHLYWVSKTRLLDFGIYDFWNKYLIWIMDNTGKDFVLLGEKGVVNTNPKFLYLDNKALDESKLLLQPWTLLYYRYCDWYIEARRKQLRNWQEVMDDMVNCSWPILDNGETKPWYMWAYKVIPPVSNAEYNWDYLFHYLTNDHIIVFTTRWVTRLTLSKLLLPENIAQENYFKAIEQYEKDYNKIYLPKVLSMKLSEKTSLDKELFDILNLKEYLKLRTTQYSLKYADLFTNRLLEYYKNAYYLKNNIKPSEIKEKWDSFAKNASLISDDISRKIVDIEKIKNDLEATKLEVDRAWNEVKEFNIDFPHLSTVTKKNNFWDLNNTAGFYNISFSNNPIHQLNPENITDNPVNTYFPFWKWTILAPYETTIKWYYTKEKDILEKNHYKELYDASKKYFASRYFFLKNRDKLQNINFIIPLNKTNELKDPSNNVQVSHNSISGTNYFNNSLKGFFQTYESLLYDFDFHTPETVTINNVEVTLEKYGKIKDTAKQHINKLAIFDQKAYWYLWDDNYLYLLNREKDSLKLLFPNLKDDFSNLKEFIPTNFLPIYLISFGDYPNSTQNQIFETSGALNYIFSAINIKTSQIFKILEKVSVKANIDGEEKSYSNYIEEINKMKENIGGVLSPLSEEKKIKELLKATPLQESLFFSTIYNTLRTKELLLKHNFDIDSYINVDGSFEKDLLDIKDKIMNSNKLYPVKENVTFQDPANPTQTITKEVIQKKKLSSLFTDESWENLNPLKSEDFIKYKNNLVVVKDFLLNTTDKPTQPLDDSDLTLIDNINFIIMYNDYRTYIKEKWLEYAIEAKNLEDENKNILKELKNINLVLCENDNIIDPNDQNNNNLSWWAPWTPPISWSLPNTQNCVNNLNDDENIKMENFKGYLKYMLPTYIDSDIQKYAKIYSYFGNVEIQNWLENDYKLASSELFIMARKLNEYIISKYWNVDGLVTIPNNINDISLENIKKIIQELTKVKSIIEGINVKKIYDEIAEIKAGVNLLNKNRFLNIKNYDDYPWNKNELSKSTINDFLEEKRVYEELIEEINNIDMNNIESYIDYYIPTPKFFHEMYYTLLKNIKTKKLLYTASNLKQKIRPNEFYHDLITKSVSLEELDKNTQMAKTKSQEVFSDAFMEYARKLDLSNVNFSEYILNNFDIATDPKNEHYNFSINSYIPFLTNNYNVIIEEGVMKKNDLLSWYNAEVDSIVAARRPLLNSWYNDYLITTLERRIDKLEEKNADLLRNYGKIIEYKGSNKQAVPYQIEINEFLNKDGITEVYAALADTQLNEGYRYSSFDNELLEIKDEINKLRLDGVSTQQGADNRTAVLDPIAEKAKRTALLNKLSDIYDRIEIIVDTNTKRFIEQYFHNIYISLWGINNITRLKTVYNKTLVELNKASINETPNQLFCVDNICGDIDDNFIIAYKENLKNKYTEILGRLLTEKYDKYVRPLITIYGKNDVVDFTNGTIKNTTDYPESIIQNNDWTTITPTITTIGEYNGKQAKFIFYKNILIGITANSAINQLEEPWEADNNLKLVFTDNNSNRTNYTVINTYREAPLQRSIFIRIPWNKIFESVLANANNAGEAINPNDPHHYIFSILIPNGTTSLTLEDKQGQKLIHTTFPAVYSHDKKELIKTQIEIELSKLKDMTMPTEKMFNDVLYTRLMTLAPFDLFKKIDELESPLKEAKREELFNIVNEKINWYGFLVENQLEKYSNDMQELLVINDMIMYMNVHNYENMKTIIEQRLTWIIFQDAKDYLMDFLEKRFESIETTMNSIASSKKLNEFDKLIKEFNFYLTDTNTTNIDRKKDEIDAFINNNISDLAQAQRLRELLLQEYERLKKIIERNKELAKYQINETTDNQDIQILNALTEAFGTQNIRQIKESIILQRLLTVVNNAYTIDQDIFNDLTDATKVAVDVSESQVEGKTYEKINIGNIVNRSFENVVKMKWLSNIDTNDGRNDMAKFNILVLKNGNYNIPIDIGTVDNNINDFLETWFTPIPKSTLNVDIGSGVQGIQYRSMEIPIINTSDDNKLIGKKDDLWNNKVFLLWKHMIFENMPSELMVMKNYNNAWGNLTLHSAEIDWANTISNLKPIYLGDMIVDESVEKQKILENDAEGLKIKRLEVVAGSTEIPDNINHFDNDGNTINP